MEARQEGYSFVIVLPMIFIVILFGTAECILTEKNSDTDSDTCIFDGAVKTVGDQWSLDGDACTTCACNYNGMVTCSKHSCSNFAGCIKFENAENKCCPKCMEYGCHYGNHSYPVNAHWKDPDDACIRCHCDKFGQVVCATKTCMRKYMCIKTVKVPGRCCPKCAKTWVHGGHGDGEKDSKECLYRGRGYPVGDFFPNSDPCARCVCSADQSVTCQTVTCPELKCKKQITPSGQCCPVCKKKWRKHHKKHRKGKHHPAKVVACGDVTCPALKCKKQITPPGQCCPVCKRKWRKHHKKQHKRRIVNNKKIVHHKNKQ